MNFAAPECLLLRVFKTERNDLALNAGSQFQDTMCKRSEPEAPNSRAVATVRSVVAAVVMCLAVFLGTLHLLEAAAQQAGAGTDARKSLGVPAITATPSA
jgi:hypothetical protein